MTLFDLMKRASDVGVKFNSWQIPLKCEGQDVEITFDVAGSSKNGWVINLRIEKKLRKNEKGYQPSGKNKKLCIYNDGAFCKKGLPGTQCDVVGCVAYKEK